MNERPPELDLVGDDALRALRFLLPPFTRGGGSPETVRAAVTRLEAEGAGASFVAALSRHIERNLIKRRELRQLPRVDRLALEMALSEELEQRAMQGELALLEAAWREAEEIAAIADDLFLPIAVRRYVGRRREPRAEDP